MRSKTPKKMAFENDDYVLNKYNIVKYSSKLLSLGLTFAWSKKRRELNQKIGYLGQLTNINCSKSFKFDKIDEREVLNKIEIFSRNLKLDWRQRHDSLRRKKIFPISKMRYPRVEINFKKIIRKKLEKLDKLKPIA